jgi:spore germination cell wall hydrolase CwlJ-like protein
MVKTENILGLPMVVIACFMILFSSAYMPKAINIVSSGIESTGTAMKTSLVSLITDSDQTPVVAGEPQTSKKPVNAEELKCMTDNIYYEAASQSVIGKIAVGRVVLNRVRDPRFPKSVCAVVYQGSSRHGEAKKFGEACQFSWTCEGPAKAVYNERYEESKKVAYQLLAYNSFSDSLKNALYFHADSVAPYWSKQKKLIAKIDNHLFYVDR